MTVGIIDDFLYNLQLNESCLAKDLFKLLGITALFMAAKVNEISPLSVTLVQEEVGHK